MGPRPHRPLRPASRLTGAFAAIGQRLIDHGVSDGTINDFGPVHSIFFRDPNGLEEEALIGKD